MRAIVTDRFGAAELGDVAEPRVGDDEVLVRVRAAGLNAMDWYSVMGRPYVARPTMGLRKPKTEELGVDFSGVVEAVGGNVTRFEPGDEVFGGRAGAFAEYVCVPEDRALARKPANMTFEQAAVAPVAALTALQGLRDKAALEPGQQVLVNGASGGVGTFAVQIAKVLGAEVTAVCSTRNVEQARALGADHVVDYTKEDFTRSERRYDVIIDIAGSRPWSACRRVLKPHATFVIVGGSKRSRVLGPLSHVVKVRLAALRASQKVIFFIAKMNKDDLEVVAELLESGKVTPAVERTYELSEFADALRYLGDGPRAKLVMTV
jgi:NADPH:quinone reductase-like Zn-dependent oxidoreductase